MLYFVLPEATEKPLFVTFSWEIVKLGQELFFFFRTILKPNIYHFFSLSPYFFLSSFHKKGSEYCLIASLCNCVSMHKSPTASQTSNQMPNEGKARWFRNKLIALLPNSLSSFYLRYFIWFLSANSFDLKLLTFLLTYYLNVDLY